MPLGKHEVRSASAITGAPGGFVICLGKPKHLGRGILSTLKKQKQA